MDYAIKNKRAATAAQTQKAKTAAPKCGAVPAAIKQEERCRRGANGQDTVSPAGDAAYGFLKVRFLPHLAGQPVTIAPADEADFFRSFALTCEHYTINPIETQSFGYPYSKALALWEANALLHARQEDIKITESRDASGRLVMQAEETYNTGSTLYYIPVVPLYRMLQDRRTKKAAQLLLCTFAYLRHIAGIPYYTDDSSYLCWQYDMIREWVEDDPGGWDDDSYDCNRSQLNTADHIGNIMQRRLRNFCHLNRFAEVVEHFVALDSFGCECLSVAEKALALWRDYPHGNVYRHADTSVRDGDDDDYSEEDCITMDKYIGFCAETKGWLYHTLAECVNNEFNECREMRQPVLTRTFDGRFQEADSLDFDCRLFSLLDDLCYLLNATDDEKD
jgi:hypothetical protein